MKTWFQYTKAERKAIHDHEKYERELKRRVKREHERLVAQRKKTLSAGSESVVVPPPQNG